MWLYYYYTNTILIASVSSDLKALYKYTVIIIIIISEMIFPANLVTCAKTGLTKQSLGQH